MTLIQRSYTVRFLTPAFLGDAEQNGAWRTPPFKALLRQWWRVAVANEFNYDYAKMREAEGRLFGNAWLKDARGENRFCKSEIRLRLADWKDGDLKSAPDIGAVNIGKNSIPASLYSGYGPVIPGKRLKASAAIQSGASANLKIALPDDPSLHSALSLAHHFGSLGGRSRNGWGSIALDGDIASLEPPLLDWKAAIQRDWAHAIGKDKNGPLIWETKAQMRWEDAMRVLAQTRADMRRKVPDRLMLSYPDTKGSMPGWRKTDRVPNSLRFKVTMRGSQFVGKIFHVPCRPADELWNKLTPSLKQRLSDSFEAAHHYLDTAQFLVSNRNVR